jgi:hypothetical protein
MFFNCVLKPFREIYRVCLRKTQASILTGGQRLRGGVIEKDRKKWKLNPKTFTLSLFFHFFFVPSVTQSTPSHFSANLRQWRLCTFMTDACFDFRAIAPTQSFLQTLPAHVPTFLSPLKDHDPILFRCPGTPRRLPEWGEAEQVHFLSLCLSTCPTCISCYEDPRGVKEKCRPAWFPDWRQTPLYSIHSTRTGVVKRISSTLQARPIS